MSTTVSFTRVAFCIKTALVNTAFFNHSCLYSRWQFFGADFLMSYVIILFTVQFLVHFLCTHDYLTNCKELICFTVHKELSSQCVVKQHVKDHSQKYYRLHLIYPCISGCYCISLFLVAPLRSIGLQHYYITNT